MINNNNNRCRHSSPTTTTFLDRCFLCRQKLLLGKDIFMYKGDKGFCSEECRCRQIFMDEEQTMLDASSFATAVHPQTTTSPPSASPPSPRPSRNQAQGFAY